MATRSRCGDHQPNDWVAYVDAHTGELLHIDEFYNPFRGIKRTPPERLVADATWEPPCPWEKEG